MRVLSQNLPSSLRLVPQVFCTFERHITEINLADPKVLKKFIGVEDNLGAYPDARGSLIDSLKDLIKSVEVLPANSDYRRAIEATAQYRLKVLAENESDQAAEEVLDSHLEELILECREEMNLLPLMTDWKPWDVPEDYKVNVYDYVDADTVLGAEKK